MKKQELSDLRDKVNNPLCIIQLQVITIQRKTSDSETLKSLDLIKSQIERIAAYLKSIKEE